MVHNYKMKKVNLYNSCKLSIIAAAITRPRLMVLAHEYGWYEKSYGVNDSSGCRAIITFDANNCLAAFQSINSKRYSKKNSTDYIKEANNRILKIAETETFKYLLEEVNNKKIPVITTAFWAIGNDVMSQDNYRKMISNGGYVLKHELKENIKEQFLGWKEEYEMTENEFQLMCHLYDRIISTKNENIIFTKETQSIFDGYDKSSKESSKEAMEKIGIIWE